MRLSVLNVPKPSWVSEDVELLAESARRFFAQECVPHYDRWEAQGSVDRDIWRKAGAAGLLCASVPEQYGGAGGSFAHDAIISRAAHHAGVEGFGISLHNAIVVPYIVAFGSEDQKRAWLPRLASGELVAALP
jgi:long-chain-acyl-CoA dehydrogenase